MGEKYKKISLTVDIIIFSLIDNSLKLLLIKRKNYPFENKWAIPGGFVDYDEEIETAAKRELEEETGINNVCLKQLQTFGTVGRDPRGRTVSVVYFAVVNSLSIKVNAGSDAKEAKWFSVTELPELAFDHHEIINFAVKNLNQNI